jgi:phosphoribosyl 1,2-cyclic phosphodiesterase
MVVKFWGVRGSIPTPERRNSRYGGNTTCIEVRLANGTLIVLDCGSGLRALGKSLLREFATRPMHGYVFLTHFHWDHIQGIPFFLPLYKSGNTILFHSVVGDGRQLKEVVEAQMVSPYFPVDPSHMAAARHFYELSAGPINLNGAIISSAPMNHPQGCVGYRIEADGASFVLATDTEPGSPTHDQALRELARDADLLVYDSQYTPEQLQGEKRGWGHSSWREGTRVARDSGAKRLVLFHHDPDSDDSFVDGLVARAREEFPNVSAASEGSQLALPQYCEKHEFEVGTTERRRESRLPLSLPLLVSWVGPEGVRIQAHAWAQNVSASGVYFIAPSQARTDQPLELSMVPPDRLFRQDAMPLHFIARAVRQESVRHKNTSTNGTVGVGARLISPAALDLAAWWKPEYSSQVECPLLAG